MGFLFFPLWFLIQSKGPQITGVTTRCAEVHESIDSSPVASRTVDLLMSESPELIAKSERRKQETIFGINGAAASEFIALC